MNATNVEYRPARLPAGYWVLLAAVLMSGTLHRPVSGATLQALLSGGSMTAGNSVFSDWQLLDLDATSGVNPDLSLINVNPLVGDPLNPGLQFTTASQLSVSGINAIDLLVHFRVDALNGSNSFIGHMLSLSGYTFGTDGGIAHISAETTNHVGADLGPSVVIVDNVSDVTQLTSTSNLSPQAGLVVVTNVFITGLTSTDSVNLTSFTQQFAQNGPPVLAGDYNQDGRVDAADYVVWRKNNGPPVGLSVWRKNFGGALSGSGTPEVAMPAIATPEPTAAALAVLAMLLLGSARANSLRLKARIRPQAPLAAAASH